MASGRSGRWRRRARRAGSTGQPPACQRAVRGAVTMSQPPDSRDLAVPLTADLRRFHISVSRRFLEKVEAGLEPEPGAGLRRVAHPARREELRRELPVSTEAG